MGWRVTVLQGGSLGDFLLSLGLVHRVAAAAPDPELCVVARSPMSTMPADNVGLHALLDADHVGLHRLFGANEPLSDELADRLAGASLIIDMLLAGRADLRQRLSAATSAHIVHINPRPAEGCTDHIIDQWTSCLRSQDVEAAAPDPSRPMIRFGDESREQLRRRLQLRCNQSPEDALDTPRVILHPGSGGRSKCWPIERFIELARRLAAEGLRPVFMLGPTELDWYGDSWVERLTPVGTVLVEPGPWEAACLMGGADLYVGNDAGSTHLAAATATPTLALFGPTDPRVWRPLGPAVRALAPDSSSSPDMTWLSVEDAHAACRRLLAERPTCG